MTSPTQHVIVEVVYSHPANEQIGVNVFGPFDDLDAAREAASAWFDLRRRFFNGVVNITIEPIRVAPVTSDEAGLRLVTS